MSNDRNLYLDVYNLQEQWLQNIAKNHFELDDENLLRVGLLGYVNEVMSNTVEDTNFMTNTYYNEIIPIRANLPDSIYAYASQVKYDGFTASPARQNFILAIRKEDILNVSSNDVTNDGRIIGKSFLIDKNSYLEIDSEYRFFLEYDIQIDIKQSNQNSDVFLTPKYVVNKADGVYEFIPSVVSKLNGEDFIFLNIYGHELSYTQQTFTVYETDIINSTSFELNFTGQLSHFNVYYKPNTNSNEIYPLKKYFLDELEPEGDRFCFYRYMDNKTIEIFFSPYSGYFRPEFNSQIIVDIYTTNGSKGNFHYTGTDSLFYIATENYKNKNIITVPYISEPSAGGTDVLDITSVKQKVVDQFSVRHNIITESDLNKFFNDNDKESEILFVKRRDDIFKRIFSAFILAKDEQSNILPTNTIAVSIHEDDIDIKNENLGIYMFKNHKLINKEGSTYIPAESSLKPSIDANSFVYATPTLMKINISPLSVVHYNVYTNDYKTVNFNYSNNESLYEFIINDINIYRDPALSDQYELKFELATSLDKNEIITKNEKGTYTDTGNVKVKAILTQNNTFIGYLDFQPIALNHDNDKILYRAILRTSDYIDNAERIEILNSIKIINTDGEGQYRSQTFISDSDVKIELCVFYKNGTTNRENKLTGLKELDEYCLANSFRMTDDLVLFSNLDRMMNTNVRIEEHEEKLIFTCDSVPVVSYDYYIKNGSTKIFNIIKFFASYLKSNLNKLENNFDIDIKFFNTFGKSKWFTVGLDKENLDSVNIKIKFRIKSNISLDSNQKASIKEFIRNYLESINTNKLRSIYISNLIRLLENNFPYIVYVEFLGFNDYDTHVQILESSITDINEIMGTNKILNFVPEYLNLNKLQNNNGEFEPEIHIEYL